AFGIGAIFGTAFVNRRRRNRQNVLPGQPERCLGGTQNAMAGHFHCKSVSFGTGKSNKTFLQPGPDFVGVSRGIQRRHPVRKTKLLSTAAMALLRTAGAVSAKEWARSRRNALRPHSKLRRLRRWRR